MKVSRDERVRGFYEYMYWKALDLYNLNEDIKAIRDSQTPRNIMVSEGSVLHDKWLSLVEQNGHSLEKSGIVRVMSAMNHVLSERMGGAPVFETCTKDDKAYRRMLMEYNNLLGQDRDSGAVFEGDDKRLVMTKGHFMPISPYDNRFSGRSAVLDNGSRLGGVPGEVDVDFDELSDISVARHVPYAGNVAINYSNREDKYVRSSSAYGEDGPQLVSDDDVAGLSQLKGFMTSAEYDKVRDWVISGMDVDDVSPKAMAARQRGIDRSVAIMRGLQSMGQEYTVTPDINRGQVSANITGTRIRVRLTDTPENAKYVGKVYDNGAEVRFKSTYRAYDPKTKRSGYVMVEPTPEDSLNLVRFALGNDVKHEDGTSVGSNGRNSRRIKSGQIQINKAYHTKDAFFAEYGRAKDPHGNVDDKYGNVVRITMSHQNRSDSTTPMPTEADADAYLREAIRSARENYANELNADGLIAEWAEHHDDEDYSPTLSEDPDIAVIQHSYLDVLDGHRETLLRPGYSRGDYEDGLNSLAGEEAVSGMVYPSDMSAAEIVRSHASDIVEHDIGSYDMDAYGNRFNPVGVSKYMTSAYSGYRNNDDIVKAMRMLDIPAEQVKGDDFYNKSIKDKLVKFDYASSEPMSSRTSQFMQSMFKEISESLARNGVSVERDDDIRIDKHGIVRYAGYVHTAEQTAKEPSSRGVRVEGEIGQIFEPDEDNVVYTHFNSGQDYAFVPGYEARIIPQMPGETKSVEERTRLVGYEQAMRSGIRYRLRQDLVSAGNGVGVIGETTSLNQTYGHLYDERHDVDFKRLYLEQGMSEETLRTILETESSRVRYPNSVRDGSTIHASYMAKNGFGQDLENDNTNDAFVLTGGRNISILTSESDGYFDPIMTTATSTNQGSLRYLVGGATVNEDGSISPSYDKNDRCALMRDPMMKHSDYDPFDRQNMTVSNILDASSVTDKTNVALMPLGGWNMDDGIVVSKKFADSHKMRSRDGSMRELIVGDKMSDLHGNKGVISLIVDSEMPDADAEAAGIVKQVKLFRENPDLDVVMAPFSAPSRFNGGAVREIMSGEVSDINGLDGETLFGTMGQMRFIITNKAADVKTRVYDDEEIAAGNGRKASAQLAWALNAKDANAIMAECYGRNDAAFANMRELLITCGLDVSETGELRRGYQPHQGEVRNVIEQPEMAYITDAEGKRTGIDRKVLRKQFADIISRQGGVLEIPFELHYPTGEAMPPLNDGKTDVVYTEQEWEQKGYTRKDGTYVRPTTVHRRIETGQRQTGGVTYGMPVMSSYLRSGQQFADGTSTTHDYSHQYEDIFIAACEYRDAMERKAHPELYSEGALKRADAVLESSVKTAQARYNRIAGDVKSRSFEGKHNVFRDNIMSRKMPNSATAIWSEDPRLDIDQVSVGSAMAATIGLKDGDGVLVWRDPILRDGGIRYLNVKVDDSVTGVSINPVIAKSFDGDFDGDTVGLVNLQTKAAQREAREKFSVEANLLDYGHKDAEGKYDLYFSDGLDIKVAESLHPELGITESLDTLKDHVNSFESMARDGMIDERELADFRKGAVENLSDTYRKALDASVGAVSIDFSDPKSHIKSVHAVCVDTGAKGSTGKVVQYAKWSGFDAPVKSDGSIDYDNVTDAGKTLATREMQQQVMYATAVKSFGTGIAGAFSQRAVAALRNDRQKEVLELTYPVTQSLLQAKHDAVEAESKYDMLMGPVRHLWRGEAQTYDADKGRWVLETDADGQPVQASREDWKQTFKEMYTRSTVDGGLNVDINDDYIDRIAEALSENGVMKNIESEKGRVISAPLDRLAYGGNFDTLVELADENRNLFEGRYNSQFAPLKVRRNVQALESGETDKVRAFMKQDAVESGKVRNLSRTESVSVGSAVRKLPDISGIEPEEPQGEFGE